MAHAMDHEKVNILLVDDQPAKLLAYEVILKELNENLVVATSGREALEHLLKNEVAVILVDVCMPELDGFELAAMIRDGDVVSDSVALLTKFGTCGSSCMLLPMP